MIEKMPTMHTPVLENWFEGNWMNWKGAETVADLPSFFTKTA